MAVGPHTGYDQDAGNRQLHSVGPGELDSLAATLAAALRYPLSSSEGAAREVGPPTREPAGEEAEGGGGVVHRGHRVSEKGTGTLASEERSSGLSVSSRAGGGSAGVGGQQSRQEAGRAKPRLPLGEGSAVTTVTAVAAVTRGIAESDVTAGRGEGRGPRARPMPQSGRRGRGKQAVVRNVLGDPLWTLTPSTRPASWLLCQPA